MRSNEIVRAKNYIKKHERRKRWIAFALCLSLLTGTLTMYGLNKPATAMTADGAKKLGVVLETANSEFEEGLIEETLQNKESSEAGESQDPEDGISKGTDAEGTSEVTGGSDNAGGNPDEGKEIAAEGEESEDSSKSNETAETDPESGTEEEGKAEDAEADEIIADDDSDSEETSDSKNGEAGNVNDKTYFVAECGDIKVEARVSNPEVFPAGIALKAGILDSRTEGYNYDAYMEALNAADASEYTEDNTILLDIAFMLDGVEYEPENSSVSVKIEFTDSRITDELKASSPDELVLVHLPVDSLVMDKVDSTEEATDITADDITVESMTLGDVVLGEDKDTVSFEADSFSVYALSKMITRSDDKYTWSGEGLKDNSAPAIIESLGNAIYFGVVADYFTAERHFEANVAVNTLSGVPEDTLFDYGNYIKSEEYATYQVEVTKKSNVPGTFSFGIFDNKDGTGTPLRTFDIEATEFTDGMYTGSILLDDFTGQKGDLYVYEYDSSGRVVTDSWIDGSYEVEYSSVFNAGNDATDALLSSYVTNGGSISDSTLLSALHPGSSIYYPTSTGYMKVTNINDDYLEKTPMEGKIPVKAGDLLSNAAELSKVLPYATVSDTVDVLNVVATTGDFMTDLYNAGKAKYGWTDQNDVQNREKGVKIPDGKILVINLDLTQYANSSYSTTHFVINGKNSGDLDFDQVCGRVIINPVVDTGNGVFSPYAGTFEPLQAVGTVLAPYATVIEHEVNGSVIGKNVSIGNGEIHKTTLISYLKIKGRVGVVNKNDRPKGKIVKKWDGVKPSYGYIYAYVCARTLGYSTKSGDSKYKDLPEYSFLVELNESNNWTAEITFPKDYYNDIEDENHKIIYRVVEIDDVKEDGVSRYSRQELETILKNIEDPKRKSNTEGGILIYDDKEYEGIDGVTYKVTYDSNSPEKTGYSSTQRIIYYAGDNTDTYEVKITNSVKEEKPYTLEVLKYVDGKAATSDQTFSFTLKYWDADKLQWQVLATDIKNGSIVDGNETEKDSSHTNKVSYVVHPSALGMEVGENNDYYFMFTENTSGVTGYTTDPNKILVKIKHYKEETDTVKNEICYYIYTPEDAKYLTIETNPSEDDAHWISDAENIAFYNYSSTSIEVIKKWGENGSHNGHSSTFDITAVLKRRHVGEDGSKYVEVARKNIAKGTTYALFNDLPVYDKDTGGEYEYAVDEYYGDEILVLNGESVNGYKLTDYTVSEDGKVITLVNQPVIIIEKEWTKNGKPILEEEAKSFGTVFVNVYQGRSNKDPVQIAKALPLSGENNWRQEIVVPRIYINGNGNAQQYMYYIVECNRDGEETGTGYITTYSASGGKSGQEQGNAAIVYGSSHLAELKLMVTNERGVNVLPDSGGIGDVPFKAAGLFLAMLSLIGAIIYSAIQKKNKVQRRGKGNERN
ncbi:MAG: hypothetical protein E7307_11320 [Butyrivibrio sp.]|nr:hypothetical protein [Butyrivibrio sp.]